MKNLLFILLLTVTMHSAAQSIATFRLNGYAGYLFDDKVDSYYSNESYYNGKIKGGFYWGAGVEYMLKPEYGLEVIYLRQDTEAPINYWNYTTGRADNADFDLAINYIMLGVNRYFPVNPKLEPFFGIQLGTGLFDIANPDNGRDQSATKFAWGIRGGIDIWATDQVGIKLQAGLLSAVQSAGGSLYFGTGGGGAGVSSYSTMLQFGLGGGLVFKMGGSK